MNKVLILVVEDDAPIRNLITTTLKAHDYKYIIAPNGESAIMEASSHNPDIVLLDLGLPDIDGVEVIKRIRTWSNMPIIVISARSEDNDKIEALDSGADDYLTKPFMTKELLARIRALGRRNIHSPDGTLTFGDISLNPGASSLSSGENNVRLSEKELRILEYLISNQGQILTREQIALKVWGYDSDTEYNNVEVYISFVRKKLHFVKAKTEIKAVRGMGYELRYEDV